MLLGVGSLAPHQRRWRADPLGRDLARVEGRIGGDTLEVAIARSGADGTGGRKRIRVNGVGRRASVLGRSCGSCCSPRRRCCWSLARRRCDGPPSTSWPRRASRRTRDDLATYGRTLQQRNSLLRAIREEQARRATSCGSGTRPSWTPAGRVVEARLRLLETLADPLAAAHREIAPEEAAAGALTLRYVTNAPAFAGETPGTRSLDASSRRPRRRSGTARRSSGRTATTSRSSSPAGIWPGSRRAASNAPRSWLSSWPSWTS